MISIIVTIVVLVFGKFIYDTYLTGNTEREWQDFKKKFPHEAKVVENSTGLDFRTKASLRTDGVYMCRLTVNMRSGEDKRLTMLFLFNRNGMAFFDEKMGHMEINPEAILELLLEFDDAIIKDKCEYITPYFINNGGISITFDLGGPNSMTWNGTIVKDGLLLDYIRKGYDLDHQTHYEEKIFSDTRFFFIRARDR